MRELHFAVERAGLLAEGEMIDVSDLPPEIVEKTGRRASSATPPETPRRSASRSRRAARGGATPTRTDPTSARVRAALEQAKWRREKAAEILGVSPRTLYRWIKKLGL